MNILLSSVGRRSYLVKYFKEALGGNGTIHVSNSSSITPAFECADYSVETPLIYDKNYIPFLLKYCKKNNIKILISLFDIDLPILSKNKALFEEIGVEIIVSDEKVIKVCNDKMETYQFLLNNKIKTPATYSTISQVRTEIKKGSINYPLIIKPRWGMGSIGIFEVDNEQELTVLFNKTMNDIKNSYLKYESEKDLNDSIIIQEKLNGQEYGLDVINDLEGNYQTTIVKMKYAMRSGETDAAITIDSNELQNLGKSISKTLKHIGNLDVDVFVVNGIPYILEMNARFGGGYPFSHVAGVNLPKAIIKWVKGEVISKELLKEKIGVLSHKDINILIMEEKLSKSTQIDGLQIKRLIEKNAIIRLLKNYDEVFYPSISSRINNIEEYTKQKLDNAYTLVADDKNLTVGFITFYSNNFEEKTAYISFLAVLQSYRGKNIGQYLINHCYDIATKQGMVKIKLEVQIDNLNAIKFYQRNGFTIDGEATKKSFYMVKDLVKDEVI